MGLFKAFSSLLITTTVFLAVASTLSAQEQTVIIHPKKPQPGETVTVTYHTNAPDAKITSPDSLKLILTYAPYLFNVPEEIKMKKTDKGWSASFELSNHFKLATFYLKSGEKVDKNKEGHKFHFFAYEKGVPVKGAYLMEASRVDNRYSEASKMRQADIRAHLIAKALAAHPENYEAQIAWYAFLLEQEYVDSAQVKAMAYETIQHKLTENPKSYKVLRAVKSGYRQIGEVAKGDSLQESLAAIYPNSDVAMFVLYQNASDLEDEKKKTALLLKYVKADYNRSFFNKYYTEQAYETLFEYYAKQDSIEEMKRFAKLWLKPNKKTIDKLAKSGYYKQAARTIAENTKQYELAHRYAQKARELTNKEPVGIITTINGRKLRYLSDEETQDRLKDRKSEILAALGFIHTNMEQYEKAEETLLAAKALSDDQEILKDLANLYVKMEEPRRAYDVYWQMLLEEPFKEELRSKLKKSYIAYNGSEEGFNEKLVTLESEWRAKTVAKLKKEMKDKEAPSLASVTDLQGNSVDLATLKNKVVILDFWATWCGPCLSAFPYLQAVYEKYEKNPNVKFLVINSAWGNTIEDAIKWTKEGDYAKNNYTFPLYYDKNSKVTTAFDVRGIPTTFVLGKDGNIKFKKVGYSGPLMEHKLALRIEMLLSDEPIAATGKR